MKLKVLTLTWDSARDKMDDGPLERFLHDRDADVDRSLLSATEHFFVQEGRPVLLLTLRYQEIPRKAGKRTGQAPNPEPRDELGPDDRGLYKALAVWRGQEARDRGVSHYTVGTNRMLAELARQRPKTMAALMEIKGIGEGRAGRWGQAMLQQIAAWEARGAPQAVQDDEST